MKVAALFVALAVCGSATKVTPVGKVIEMLNEMVTKCEANKLAEQKVYAAYAQWCKMMTAKKTWELEQANAKIEELVADIAKYEADILRLTDEIEALDMDIASWQTDLKEATGLRASEHKDYEIAHADYSESVYALERAIAVLKKQDYSRVQASLVQVANLKLVDAQTRKQITAFLSQDPNTSDFLDYSAPEANAYEFQSGGVIDMLEKLHVKFQDELASLEKEESNAKHAFEMLAQDLNDQIETASANRARQAEAKSVRERELADAKQDLAETTALRDACQKFLDSIAGPCAIKGDEFEARQKLRDEEIATLKQAIEIIEGQVAGNAKKYLPNLVQTSKATKTKFVQLRSATTNPMLLKAVAFLKAKAEKFNSRMLMQVATKAQDDPFKKVKQMISDLIVRLLEQANEEAEHHGWCMTELASNEQTRKQKTAEIDVLTSKIDKLEADIAELAQDITDLNTNIADLEAQRAEATKLREEEHAENMETIKDGKESGAAVETALRIIKEFYASAADATALNQIPEEEIPPSTWDQAYKGLQVQKGGVVGMLEVIQSDFARLVSETEAEEAEAAKTYKDFMNESSLNLVAMNKDVQYKEYEKENKEAELESAKTDLRNTQAELDAALAYYEKLKPSCVDAGVSYEDRVARRQQEIESLQEALRILNGESFEA